MKRWLSYAAIALVLAACSLDTGPPLRGEELEAATVEMMQFIDDRSRPQMRKTVPPRIEFVDDIGVVMSARYGDRFAAMIDGHDGVVIGGYYDYRDMKIYLPTWWRGSVEHQSWLFHEIVHYLQHVNGRNRCASANEREAYDLERQWIGHTTGRLPPRDWMDKFIPDACSAT